MNQENNQGGAPKSAVRRQRNWKRIHHSPLFWIGALMFLMAIMIYILSDDLAWRPYLH
jgi:hypothetical protein